MTESVGETTSEIKVPTDFSTLIKQGGLAGGFIAICIFVLYPLFEDYRASVKLNEAEVPRQTELLEQIANQTLQAMTITEANAEKHEGHTQIQEAILSALQANATKHENHTAVQERIVASLDEIVDSQRTIAAAVEHLDNDTGEPPP